MIKSRLRQWFIPGLMLGMMLNVFELRTADAGSVARLSVAAERLTLPPAANSASNGSAVLDGRRQVALGMVETGNNDREIGGLGEISRYQIMPSVWKQYSQSQYYQNPNVSLMVAQLHWSKLYAAFKKQAQREPSDFDMYVLWNTRYGYYASKGFNPARLSPAVHDRAQRFVNLVQCGDL